MVTLAFEAGEVRASRNVAEPHLELGVRISAPADSEIQCLLLGYQVRILAAARGYASEREPTLRHLFGSADCQARPLSDLLWARGQVTVAGFQGATLATLALPCSFDFNVAAAQFFHALDGAVPVAVFFDGTVFSRAPGGTLQATPIPWSSELRVSIPVKAWEEVVALHYPEKVAVPLDREVFDALLRYRLEHGLTSWDEVMARLLR